MTSNSVTASVEVAVDPATAFAIFTGEIGRWWRPGPINWYDSARAISIRFEPGVGGRWIEIYDPARLRPELGSVFVILSCNEGSLALEREILPCRAPFGRVMTSRRLWPRASSVARSIHAHAAALAE